MKQPKPSDQTVKDGKRIMPFTPPEGVPISFAIASIGSRLGAQTLDIIFIFIVFFILGIVAYAAGFASTGTQTLFMLLGFLLRTPYYALSELIWNGRTLGKRITGIRVINVDGRRLTPHQVTARNLMKEVEIFTPAALLFSIGSKSPWQDGLTIVWLLAVMIVPLANRRRQRIGDIVAGTLVVDNPRSVLLSDLALSAPATLSSQLAFEFLPEHLDVYGKYELQTLEDVLRDTTKSFKNEEIVKIVRTITRKIRYPDPVKSGQELLFLKDFYRAQREHLESLKLFGTLRENKYHEHTRTEAKKLV